MIIDNEQIQGKTMNAANIIKTIRKDLGLTQIGLASIVHTTNKNICNYEKRGANAPADRFLDILRLCPDDDTLIKLIRE